MTIIEKDTADGRNFRRQIQDLVKLKVIAGFPEGGAKYENGDDVAAIAAVNEFGTSDGRIPARPFLSNSVELHKEEIDKFTDGLFDRLCDGRIDADECMRQLGEFQKGLIQQEITDGIYAPNAPSTIAKKGSDHPLIDTGLMMQSVDFEVKGGGE